MLSSLLLAILLSLSSATAASAPGLAADAAADRVEFRIKNDTGSSVRIHTGTGASTIGNGSSNRYQADVGQEFRLDSSSGDLLFEVSDDHDGETLDLSDYL